MGTLDRLNSKADVISVLKDFKTLRISEKEELLKLYYTDGSAVFSENVLKALATFSVPERR